MLIAHNMSLSLHSLSYILLVEHLHEKLNFIYLFFRHFMFLALLLLKELHWVVDLKWLYHVIFGYVVVPF